MNDWTAGYVADIGYTYGYYTELNPLRLRLAFLSAGLAYPEVGTACELGFGQGVSTNIHAAASVTTWHGTDFNPAQAGFAQTLSGASGAAAKLLDEAFDHFCARADLPEFDYIGLHGIWSWISDENRAVIVDFVRRKLKVGGVLYISYNTQPGWAPMVPIRNLLAEHVELMGAPAEGIVPRIDAALTFADKLLAVNPIYATANPQIAGRLQKMREQNRSYLAHEYFNRDWHPMSFSHMAELLGPAKVNYACSAHYLDHIDAINLTPDQQMLLKEIPDPLFRESVRDFCVNQQFRRDYWVKGARKLNALEQAEGLAVQRVILVQPRSVFALKVKGALGEASLQASIYDPILDCLADHQPKTLKDVGLAVQERSITAAQVLQASIVLTGMGCLMAVQEDQIVEQAKPAADKLNRFLMNKARGSGEVNYLASPLTGGAIGVGRFQQLFLLARESGYSQPAEWAQFVWQTLQRQGASVLKDGKTLGTAEENLAELNAQASVFAEKQLPILKALRIA